MACPSASAALREDRNCRCLGTPDNVPSRVDAMTPQRLFLVAAVGLTAVGVMSLAEAGLGARIFQALAFFGAGVFVAQVLRPSEPASAAPAQQPPDGAAERP